VVLPTDLKILYLEAKCVLQVTRFSERERERENDKRRETEGKKEKQERA